jgi:hypothetical protein
MIARHFQLRLLCALLLGAAVCAPVHSRQPPANKAAGPNVESVGFCDLLLKLVDYSGKRVQFDAVISVGQHYDELVNLGPRCAKAMINADEWRPALFFDYARSFKDEGAKRRVDAIHTLLEEWTTPSRHRGMRIPVRVTGKLEVTPLSDGGFAVPVNLPGRVVIEDIEELR